MRKVFVLFLTLVFALGIATTAFAGEPKTVYYKNEVVYYGNANGGSIGNGLHGHSWYADGDYAKKAIVTPAIIKVKGTFSYKKENNFWQIYKDKHLNIDWKNYRYRDYDGDGQWHFYKDAKGVFHYFYIDPDVEGEWVRYKDSDGNNQYDYVV